MNRSESTVPHTPSGPSCVSAKNSRACKNPWIGRIRFAAGLAASLSAIGLLAAVGLTPAESSSIENVSFASTVNQRANPPDAPAGVPGWYARYSPGTTAAVKEIKTQAPYAAFALEKGQSTHPGATAKDLQATFDADVTLDAAGKYRFGAEVEGGSLQITVLGERMAAPITLKLSTTPAGGRFTNWIDLPAGKVSVQYQFKRTGDARARLRSLWQRQGFGKTGFRVEPIPPTLAKVPDQTAGAVREAQKADHGRVLLSELGCVHCHTMEAEHRHNAGAPAANPLEPFVHSPAPSLQNIGSRASPYWLTKWMADPQGEKPGCGMPGVLRGKDMGTDAESITHFLVSLSPGFQREAVATEPAGLALAKKTYQSLGCVACHGAEPGVKTAPIPLTGLAGKWNPSELSQFLMDPRKVRESGRMPSLNLNKQEADLLATHLITSFGESKAPTTPFTVDAAKATAGRAAFAARGCASCHSVTDAKGVAVESEVHAAPLAALGTGGCLDPKGTPKAPKYTLASSDREAITLALAQIKSWTGGKGVGTLAASPIDKAHLTIDQLSCRNCHEVHGVGGVSDSVNEFFTTIGEADLGDEGRLPPRLLGTGAKLTTAWMHQVLEDAGRARPYMASRMPQFGAEHVGFLSEQLAAIEGVWPNSDATEPESNDEMVQNGRTLAGVNGLNCISCHLVGDNAPAGTPGPDMQMFGARIRYEWWMNYVHAPSRYKPGTKMPSFYENGPGTVTSIYGGDSVKQADALWSYFNLGEFMPAPEGLTKPEGFVIKVGARPVIMRSFLKEAGSRGIAVGFPETMGGLHFAFDAERVRLVDAWQGSFLNASGAWAGRGGNVTGGQGSAYWTAPAGPSIVIGAQPKEWPTQSGRDAGYRFKGYRLDENGFPTFEYDVTLADKKVVRVAERFEPLADKRIKRTFEIRGVPSGSQIWLRAGRGAIENTSIMNVAEVKTTGKDDDQVVSVSATAANQPISFSVTIKP